MLRKLTPFFSYIKNSHFTGKKIFFYRKILNGFLQKAYLRLAYLPQCKFVYL